MGRINYSYNYLLSLIANRPLYRYTDSVMDSTTVLSRMSSGRQNSRVEYSTNHLISQQSGVSESDIESRIADAPPIITMSNGNATEVYHERYTSYTDLTGTAVDDVDVSLPVTASGDTVDVNTLGTYVRTYSATDSAGQTTTVTRNIIVQDTIDPTAVLNITASSLNVTVSLTSISENNCTIVVYSDSGYTTLITSATTTTETSKDLTFTESSAGTYTYYVRITDQSSNFSDYSASIELTEISTPSAYLDTLTADSTISGIASDGAPSTLSDLDSGVVYITGNFTSRPAKVMFEAGGIGRGIIIYVKYYNTIPYLYAQCGDGSVSGGDVELVWEITSSFSTVIVSFCNAGVNGGVNRLYVDDILRDTQNNGSYGIIEGSNEGGTGKTYDSYAVNRLGTVGEFAGETITTTKIYKSITLDPDDF